MWVFFIEHSGFLTAPEKIILKSIISDHDVTATSIQLHLLSTDTTLICPIYTYLISEQCSMTKDWQFCTSCLGVATHLSSLSPITDIFLLHGWICQWISDTIIISCSATIAQRFRSLVSLIKIWAYSEGHGQDTQQDTQLLNVRQSSQRTRALSLIKVRANKYHRNPFNWVKSLRLHL